ncbi:hypothetical protein CLLU_12810 [Clostridium luticellarii]|jgi:hypothetical protein|uniref:Uncharacterized protein n=1 Tax=Clostridium luticellarii TaxID=1691940 RepID=A0A2T0BPN2_9CLOT|nr:hypothetical protein CLLU_12810 [Clostridium luticellarii]
MVVDGCYDKIFKNRIILKLSVKLCIDKLIIKVYHIHKLRIN